MDGMENLGRILEYHKEIYLGMVSIIVPIYNGEKNIEKCILSILNQTYKKFELILIDDGSTDNSLKICYKHMKEDKRVRVFHYENSGVSMARNYGIEKSRGEYVPLVTLSNLRAFENSTTASAAITFSYFGNVRVTTIFSPSFSLENSSVDAANT